MKFIFLYNVIKQEIKVNIYARCRTVTHAVTRKGVIHSNMVMCNKIILPFVEEWTHSTHLEEQRLGEQFSSVLNHWTNPKIKVKWKSLLCSSITIKEFSGKFIHITRGRQCTTVKYKETKTQIGETFTWVAQVVKIVDWFLVGVIKQLMFHLKKT